ncbi:hypothetical protein HIM_02822 [Hirsutella minnesotensis 3608]|nr:hypothetical protein HIM_02822 [Hirsutella minnesotensis 3608]
MTPDPDWLHMLPFSLCELLCATRQQHTTPSEIPTLVSKRGPNYNCTPIDHRRRRIEVPAASRPLGHFTALSSFARLPLQGGGSPVAMSLLAAHLEQISYSCQGIDALQFPPPKIFTNALLANHDITCLIRDTEPHERALFSVPPPPPPPSASLRASEPDPKPSHRRQTVFNVASGEVTAAAPGRGTSHPRRRTAVAAVLGGEMHDQLRADRKGEVDVEVLLRGAEKLCGVYELPGARERIASLRSRYRNGKNTTAYYEAKVSEQTEQLASMNKGWLDEEEDDQASQEPEDESELWTEDDLRREEAEAREMEMKKNELQARLKAMNKDLGGLMST